MIWGVLYREDLFARWLKYLGLSTESKAAQRVSFFVETTNHQTELSKDFINMPVDIDHTSRVLCRLNLPGGAHGSKRALETECEGG